MPDSRDYDLDDARPHLIPSRNTEWETPFSPVAPVNADADATREVVLYSAQRRKIAITVSALALLLVCAAVGILVIATIKVGYTDERRALIIYYIGLLMTIAFCGVGVFAVWKWANVPVYDEAHHEVI